MAEIPDDARDIYPMLMFAIIASATPQALADWSLRSAMTWSRQPQPSGHPAQEPPRVRSPVRGTPKNWSVRIHSATSSS